MQEAAGVNLRADVYFSDPLRALNCGGRPASHSDRTIFYVMIFSLQTMFMYLSAEDGI